ncbi:hypothetical protein TWF679_010152 [Orbilia oligospora]|uniref:F-box domain-containing protein n=1 Tax=Orbilia oligospora TaxID=2813651 RepID=A0A8H8V0Y4_ORBOL|nr:hypothetical protein TWF679_010152 [Orbilia oligospora]
MASLPLSLGTLPLDILAYLIYDCIDDEGTLYALSLTCRVLRSVAFRRICSEKVAINLNLPGYAEICQENSLTTLLKSGKYRSVGLTKQLWVNINSLECRSLVHLGNYDRLIRDAEGIVERCPAVETAIVRECSGMGKDDILDVVHWSNKVVKLPKLRFLFMDSSERRHFRSQPDDQYIARTEGLHREKRHSNGLECLSVQNCFSGIFYDDFSPQSLFIQNTIVDNINSLNRLWFHGAELREALKEMPTASLANMRLKSLSIRLLPTHTDLVRVFGLCPRDDRRQSGVIANEDAMTGLEHLYLSDGNFAAEGELELLPYLYTPILKSLQVGVGIFQPEGSPEGLPRPFEDYLGSLSSLERFGTSGATMIPKASYLTLLDRVVASQPNFKSLAVWNSWYAFGLLFPGGLLKAAVYKSLERIEIASKFECADEGLFRALGSVFRAYSGSKSSLKTLSLGQSFAEKQYFGAREICTIVSSILYVHQKRCCPDTPFLLERNESQSSPFVETPARRILFEAISGKRSWRRPFIYKASYRNAVESYLDSFVSTLPPGKNQWNTKLSDWDTYGRCSKGTASNGIYEAIMAELPEGFKRLELDWKAERAGGKWPKDIKEWRFVWEKAEAGWELVESS